MKSLDERIAEVKSKISDVKKRWPLHSVKPAQVQELEELESELEELQKQKKTQK
ncbi:histidine kinase [Desulfolucanica intricata]|uniref:histidine kinase n=1 Tax=Desulfolucanica intricata TaxID=1285191 RepID=UPI000835B09C|nr:histidine kinase [Desulfolucanica intricata]